MRREKKTEVRSNKYSREKLVAIEIYHKHKLDDDWCSCLIRNKRNTQKRLRTLFLHENELEAVFQKNQKTI